MKLMGGLSVISALFVSVMAYAGAGSDKPSEKSLFKLLNQSPEGWEIEYVPQPRLLMTVDIDGKPYTRFLDVTRTDGEDAVGSPALPVDAITLGVPDGVTLYADLLNPEFELDEQQAIAPHPDYEFTEDQEAVEVFNRDQSKYSVNQFLPATHISVEQPFTLRQQKISVVRIRPYQYNPATQTLRRITKATLRIRMQKSPEYRPSFIPVPDPLFEQSYKSLLWNYEQAKEWRLGRQSRLSLNTDPTRDWFETGKNYYKAAVATDGWYKITRAQIEAAGGNLTSVDLSTIKVYAKGVEVPIIVRPDTSVEFFARRNYGDSTYFDFYTDTCAHWLTWGGTQGVRYASSSSSGTPLSTFISVLYPRHIETPGAYYVGTTDAELIDNGTVAGEGWRMNNFPVGRQTDFPFTLDSIDTSVPTAVLRSQLWGSAYVNPPGTPALQKARFWVNDSLVGDVEFGQRQEGLMNRSFPASWLRVGNNTLRIRAMETTGGANNFFLRWYAFDYNRMLRPVNGQLEFTAPPGSPGVPNRFFVRGFDNADIEVFDVSTYRKIEGGIVEGDSASGFTISFEDTSTVQRTYIVFASGNQRSVPPLKQKMFQDIRVNPQGADYIIITHKNFLAQANQLAAHREAVNGVRTKVIDVEDIYDEFNYGQIHTKPMKGFLKYAFEMWLAPAPSYVLLLGDASWDYHRYLGTTVKTNYVPAYGVPTGDNWFGCFNPALPFLTSLYIGRIPAEDMTQAQRTVNKIMGFDNYELSEWNKNFLFITGGVTLSEQAGFNFLADRSVSLYVKPPPLGATGLRVSKATPGYIDGENKQRLKDLFRSGLGFVSFTGHSGGKIWGVDPGPASEFENTNGRLPFVASVSCNVGGFATPSNNVFAEDLLLADNRGAIAAWASSSVGYANYGAALTNNWLMNATADSVREFGRLTTNALYRLWTETGSGYITLAMMNLNPMMGDPMSRLPIPLKPELAVSASDISLDKSEPTPNDSTLIVRVNLHNYGLVPSDSVGITLTDIYSGQTTHLLDNKKLKPTLHIDSVFVPWHSTNKVGLHTLVATLDPLNVIEEVNELNNIASSEKYIYANNLYVVRPISNMVVPSGAQRLVVTSPVGYDSIGFQYSFELDTTETFDSPALVTSGIIAADQVKGEWITPPLPAERVYFWRARTVDGPLVGNWVTSSFSTSNDLPMISDANAPTVRMKQHSRRQFSRNHLVNATPTDSGVTIAQQAPLNVFCRSVGQRYNQTLEYYSTIAVNEQKIIGYWWELGSSFMVARINDFTNAVEYRSFNTASSAALSDSMKNFINATPTGNYIAVSVIFNGQTNVNEGLKQAMDSLGATMFRSILNNQSYAFIGRKGTGGPGMTPLEQLNSDTAVLSLQVPNVYSLGNGSVTSLPVPVAQTWESLRWQRSGDMQLTNPRLAIVGVRPSGIIDTLRIFPKDSTDVDLTFLDSLTSGTGYAYVNIAGLLATSDANVTPAISAWEIDCTLPSDIAVSARSFVQSRVATFDLPVTVHNLGYRKSDSIRIVVNALDKFNLGRQVAATTIDSIEIEGNRSAVIRIPMAILPKKTLLQLLISPVNGGKDLIVENNTAYYTLIRTDIVAHNRLNVYADGKPLMDGDYVSAEPVLLVKAEQQEIPTSASQFEMLVNNKPVPGISAQASLSKTGTGSRVTEHTFTPSLISGDQALTFRVAQMNALGQVDTIEETIHVRVSTESKTLNVYSYPNPFATDTYFTFTLAGSRPPDEARIKIYTIAGRKIRDITVPANALSIGNNRVHWDGRDSDGDEIANGYYFYELTTFREGKPESSVHKLAKVR